MDTKAPQRDDPCFAGDNAAYRKAYKAWHARAKRERDAADSPSAALCCALLCPARAALYCSALLCGARLCAALLFLGSPRTPSIVTLLVHADGEGTVWNRR